MKTIALDYSHRLVSSVTAVGGECDLLSSTEAYWILKASVGINITGIMLYLKAFRKAIVSYGSKEEIDPDDILIAELQTLQQRIKSIYHKLPPKYRLHKWLIRKMHSEIDTLCIEIREHDADLSITTGSFTNSYDLNNHLNNL